MIGPDGAGLAMCPAPPYLAAMAILPPTSSPRAAIRDFLAVFRHADNRDRLLAITLSVLITTIILIVFLIDSKINTAPPPRIVYIQDYKTGRTDAEIIAQQQKEEQQRVAAAKERQRQFQKLEKRLGIE